MTAEVRVLISTKDRPEDLVTCIESVLACDGIDFDVVVVDQSTDIPASEALAAIDDPRLTVVHTDTRGLGRSRNVGMAQPGPDLCLALDDDCTVQPDWVRSMTATLTSNPDVGLVYGTVDACPHDTTAGFVPVSAFEHDERIERPSDMRALGLGAAMAFRKSALVDVGGVDPNLGAGTPLHAFEDLDIAYRLLLNDIPVMFAMTSPVTHFGFRTHEQGRGLIRGYTLGAAASNAKYLKAGRLIGLRFIVRQIRNDVVRDGVIAMRDGKKPPVLGRAIAIVKGVFAGLRMPVDRETLTFREA